MGMHFQFFSLTVFFSFTFFEYGPDWSRCQEKRESGRATPYKDFPVLRIWVDTKNSAAFLFFYSICFLQIRFRWVQIRSAPGLSDEAYGLCTSRRLRSRATKQMGLWDEFVKSSRFDELGAVVTTRGQEGERPGVRYPQSGTKHGTNRHASITSIDFSQCNGGTSLQ